MISRMAIYCLVRKNGPMIPRPALNAMVNKKANYKSENAGSA